MRRKITLTICLLLTIAGLTFTCKAENNIVWQIGKSDNSAGEFALAPDGFTRFLEEDFGWEDGFFLVGHSAENKDWPYVLPGPSDSWGGTSGTAGWRSHTLNILFSLDSLPKEGDWILHVDLVGYNPNNPPLLKVSVNGKSQKEYFSSGEGDESPAGNNSGTAISPLRFTFPTEIFNNGGNEISMTILQGSWIMFDCIKLEGPATAHPGEKENFFIRTIEPANYEIQTNNGLAQPLLIDVEHLEGVPHLEVIVDGNTIFQEAVETGRYVFEAPMPAVTSPRESSFEIKADGEVITSGIVKRSSQKQITPAGYVDTKMGTAHSRWMIAPGPWMPFSMVKLSPDNQNSGWQAGYDPIFETIGGFSHIHEWTMAGLLLMPANGPLQTQVGDEKKPDEGYRSRLNKETEKAPLGYYKAELTDYDIVAELTSTTRCGFQRYTFPEDKKDSRVLVDLQIPAEYRYNLVNVQIEKVSDTRIEGFSSQVSPNTWSGGVSQEYIVHFVIEFDQPIRNFGFWTEEGTFENTTILQKENPQDAGAWFEFNTETNQVVQVRTGISYVSIENAAQNLMTEISSPFGWDFKAVRKHNIDTWNELLQRVKITTNDQREKKRFYTNMYRALCSRNTFSDTDGKWVDADETIRQLGDPESPALGCDAFWNTFWNLNQFWNLVTPEWSNRWVNSQLAMYRAGGWLAKGPAGMEYIPVMVAEHEIPLIVGAYQMGIRDFDAELAFEAVKKMQTTPAQEVGGGFAGNRDLLPYLQYQYVPHDKGRFSNTLEYSFDDWTVSQFAKALGKKTEYEEFLERGNYWKNAIDKETGYARMKDSNGNWLPDFDPYRSGSNHHYVEGNAWQLTFFVPQNVPALAGYIGEERFIERLDWGFNESYKWRFNAPNDQYWDYPVIQGNQQSMHFAFLFNWVGHPWLTQKWSRAIIDRYYGYGLANAYLGDEDQGQMSAWFIMAALGLFQTDGGCNVNPVYEIASPLYPKTEIDLGKRYGRGEKFIIEAINASRANKYVQSAILNGKQLIDFKIPVKELLNGGNLVLEMGPAPNQKWGIQ